MALTLRLTPEEHEKLRQRAAEEGVSMQDLARRAVRDHLGLEDRRTRVLQAAQKVMADHGDALDRPGR